MIGKYFVVVTFVAALPGVLGHHCESGCDENGLYPEALNFFFTGKFGQCSFPSYCNRTTPGTGHRLYNATVKDDLVVVERCYSFCFWNVTPSLGERLSDGRISLFQEDIFSSDHQCNGSVIEALVCFSACLFTLQMNDVVGEAVQPDRYNLSSNAACTDFCTVPGGICERALPHKISANCTPTCHNELCLDACGRIQNTFNRISSDSRTSTNIEGTSLQLNWPDDENLRKQAILAFTGSYDPHTGSLDSVGTYGLIWRVQKQTERREEYYIPQHLPLFLLPQEVGPLYRAGTNLLAIRELQCKEYDVAYAFVDQYGISDFKAINSNKQCFYGSWYPEPPLDLSGSLRYSRTTGEMELDLRIGEDSPDHNLVTSYGFQVYWYPESNECKDLGKTKYRLDPITLVQTTVLDGKDNKELIVSGTSNVLEYIPTVLSQAACRYFINIFSEPQPYPTAKFGNWYAVYFRYPDFPTLKYNITYNITTSDITGLGTINIHLVVGEDRWKALVPLNKVILTLSSSGEGSISINPVDKSVHVKPSKLKYNFVFNGVKPLPSKKSVYHISASQIGKPNFPSVPTTSPEYPIIQFLARPPSRVGNLTFYHYLDLVDGRFVGNASWLGPSLPHGKVKEYIYILSSPSASVVVEHKLSVEGETLATDMSELVMVQIDVEFKNHEYFNFSVRAVSEWNVAGEWTNYTVFPEFPPEDVINPRIGLPPHVEGIIIGASILMVILIVAFITIAASGGYYYYKKNKVVIVKNTGIWINGRHDITEEEGDDGEEFQPVPVDSWEISPDIIIMDCMLGEGQFGEVYKGMIQKDAYCVNATDSKYVAVKILRPEASAALKSDFLKEIVTMKKITMGGCPHVVNMVGCSTLQEPIALVIEYISHGDLLTYLRTIRKINNMTYCNFSSFEPGRAKENEYVNHGSSPSTPMTPMTPASTCPLLINKDPSPPTNEKNPSPYEKPYSSLGELKPVDLVSFAYQISTGMEYLASLGIVHRDLACRNVLVGENKVLKISDFGMARDDEIYIKTTDGKLPLRWMAIESIVDRVFTTQSDVWSFGIVLWEITTLGGHPYPSVSNKALLAQLLRGYRMDKPENCSPEFYDVMKMCWNIRAVDRPSFIELRATFDTMLTKAQKENYIDLNVDEMLPYYSMSAVGEPNDLELTEEDLKPGSHDSKDGYPEMPGLVSSDLICSVEHLRDNDDDRSSIGSVDAKDMVPNSPEEKSGKNLRNKEEIMGVKDEKGE